MKKFWKGGSVILGEYENDEGQFGTDSNIFKPITARIMKSKHDGFFHEGLLKRVFTSQVKSLQF